MRTFASRFVFFSLSDRAAACANRDRGKERQLQSNGLQLALSHNERQEGLEARAFRRCLSFVRNDFVFFN